MKCASCDSESLSLMSVLILGHALGKNNISLLSTLCEKHKKEYVAKAFEVLKIIGESANKE